MKSKDSGLPDNVQCVEEKGTITLVAMMLVLVTILTITAIPNLSVLIPSDLKDVIVAILAAQVVCSTVVPGRHEKE